MSEENKNENELAEQQEHTGTEGAGEQEHVSEEPAVAAENELSANEDKVTAYTIDEVEAQESDTDIETSGANYGENDVIEQGANDAEPENENSEEPAEKKKKPVKLIAAISAAAVVVIVVVVMGIIGSRSGNSVVRTIQRQFNPYEKDYVDVTGRTIGEIADEQGIEYSDFLWYFGMPEDMPESTSERAAYYSMSVGAYATNFTGMDFEDLKAAIGWGDEITEDTTLGDAIDSMTVREYAGEENIEAFKAQYGLGDDVTGDTLYGDIRNDIDNYLKAEYEAAEAESSEPAEAEASEPAEADEAEEETTEEAAGETAEAAE